QVELLQEHARVLEGAELELLRERACRLDEQAPPCVLRQALTQHELAQERAVVRRQARFETRRQGQGAWREIAPRLPQERIGRVHAPPVVDDQRAGGEVS